MREIDLMKIMKQQFKFGSIALILFTIHKMSRDEILSALYPEIIKDLYGFEV